MQRPWHQALLAAGILLALMMPSRTEGAVLADSVNDWLSAYQNDGILSQGELGWEYGYISNFTGGGGVFYGWHPGSFYWDQASGINIYWPAGRVPPAVAWGEGGDATGCRPPMHWGDGAYPWAGNLQNQWAAVRRWTSSYTGAVDIAGTIGSYFDPAAFPRWNMKVHIAVNAAYLENPPIYSRHLAWNDAGLYTFELNAVPIRAGDTISFMVIPIDASATNCYAKVTAVISESLQQPSCDLDRNGRINLEDLTGFASAWQATDCGNSNWCSGADLNYDWTVDINDLVLFSADWCTRTYPAGDFDRNYRVNEADLASLSKHWLRQDCDQDPNCRQTDINEDRQINIEDLAFWVSNWLISEE